MVSNLRFVVGLKPVVNFASDLWRHNTRRFVAALGLSVISAVTESVGLFMLVPLVVSTGVVEPDDSSLATSIGGVLENFSIPFGLGSMLIIYVAVIAIKAGVGAARKLVTVRLRHSFVDELRGLLFAASAHARWSFHLKRRSSDVSHALAVDIPRVEGGASLFFDGIGQVIMSMAYLAVAIKLSPSGLLVAGGMVALLVGGFGRTIGQARKAGLARIALGKRNFATQDEFMSALKLIKSHGRESEQIELYRESTVDMRRAEVDFVKVEARSSAVIQVGTAVALAMLTWVAIEVIVMSRAELLALIVVVGRLAGIASSMLSRFQGAANLLPSYESAVELCKQATAAAEDISSRPPIPGSDGTLDLRNDFTVRLESVSFAYIVNQESLVDIDLEIPNGSVLALAGPSGAGKSTIADIVIGLLEPSSGRLTVGGIPLADFGLDEWRQRVAYVPQETFLFHDTLRANIVWAAPDAFSDDDDLAGLLEAAALTDVVAQLPEGLDTVLGDRGHRLSGGERQRVALARALARRPALLVLDEATSALDSGNEQVVQQAIERLHGQMSMLVIAHRLSTVRSADQIAVIDRGRVVEQGTWNDLIAANGNLAELAGELTHG